MFAREIPVIIIFREMKEDTAYITITANVGCPLLHARLCSQCYQSIRVHRKSRHGGRAAIIPISEFGKLSSVGVKYHVECSKRGEALVLRFVPEQATPSECDLGQHHIFPSQKQRDLKKNKIKDIQRTNRVKTAITDEMLLRKEIEKLVQNEREPKKGYKKKK